MHHNLAAEELVRLAVYAVAAFFTARIAAKRLRRESSAAQEKAREHWAERARLLFPVREELSFLLAFVPAVFVASFWVLAPEEGPRLDALVTLAIVPLPTAVLLRALAQNQSVALERPVTSSEIFSYYFGALYFSFMPHVAVLGGTVLLVELDERWWWPGTVALIAAGLLFLYWGRLPAGRLVLGIKPASHDLQTMVDGQTHRMKLSRVKAFTTTWPTLSVRALPLNRAMVFSERLIESLDPNEVAALSALELDRSKVRRPALHLAVAITMAPGPLLLMAALSGVLDWRWALGVAGLPVLVLIFSAQALRRRTQPRDSTAIERLVDSPGASSNYASALQKIHRLSGMPAHVGPTSLRQPSLYDRMLAVGVNPSFPRPEPPDESRVKRIRWTLIVTMTITALLAELGAEIAWRLV